MKVSNLRHLRGLSSKKLNTSQLKLAFRRKTQILLCAFEAQSPRSCYLLQLSVLTWRGGSQRGPPALYQHRQNPYSSSCLGKYAPLVKQVARVPRLMHKIMCCLHRYLLVGPSAEIYELAWCSKHVCIEQLVKGFHGALRESWERGG